MATLKNGVPRHPIRARQENEASERALGENEFFGMGPHERDLTNGTLAGARTAGKKRNSHAGKENPRTSVASPLKKLAFERTDKTSGTRAKQSEKHNSCSSMAHSSQME